MSADQFRDAIAATYDRLIGVDIDTQVIYPPDTDDLADVVLAMPEMQALRTLARHNLIDWCCDECRDAYLDEIEAPAGLAAWVLDGEP